MKRTHRAKVLRVAVALMASSMAVGASISAVAAPVPPSPIQLLSEALAAARSEAAVELTSHEHAGTITATGITEAGRTDGTQSITVHRGAKSGHFVTVLIGTKAYLRANDFGLEVLGFDAVAANVEASRWLVIGPGSAYGQAAYEALVSGLTVSSVVSQLTPMNSEPLGLLPTTTVDAQTVVGLQVTVPAGTGVPAGHEVLYVRSGGQPLPVETVFTQGGSSNVTVFGPWGRPPAAFAEAGAIPVRPGWLAGHQPQGLGIPGSPGYSTFTGPLGGPMQAGRPPRANGTQAFCTRRGRRCRPSRWSTFMPPPARPQSSPTASASTSILAGTLARLQMASTRSLPRPRGPSTSA
jgi:hypothetical protein